MKRLTFVVAGVVLGSMLTGCADTESSSTASSDTRLTGALTSFETCDEAVAELRERATAHTPMVTADTTMEATAADAPGIAKSSDTYSTTNVQEAGVDEPDLVKTDGKRIVTVVDGTVKVTDAATREPIGEVPLETGTFGLSQLLLHDGRALVMAGLGEWGPDAGGTRILLVDVVNLTVLNDFEIEGYYVDARAVDGLARLVVRSMPRFETFAEPAEDSQDRADRIAKAPVDDWLPDYRLDGDSGQIECGSLARPREYSGTSLLTLLTFDMAAGLDSGSPITIAADGDTVYGTADALYVANDRREFSTWNIGGSTDTEIYRFNLATESTPVFHGSGVVPGYLLNKYSLSEWNGHLRVATTTWADGQPPGTAEAEPPVSSSSVYVLAVDEDGLTEVGRIEGLGLGERIYSVRYVGDTGYVVTFREVDPLYVLDLSDPTNPAMTGELKITGYSSYLHPLAPGRLLGLGQEASDSGVALGTQVSLFDVTDPAVPDRLDQYHVPGAYSTAESDPYGFLYWEAESIVAIPLGGTALVLTVTDSTVSHRATVTQSAGEVERSLVIDDTLWTVSYSGLQANSMSDFASQAWIPFD
ncbi:beta propeller domain-containing protein [Stackebrandtia endophytica]|uniref:Beta propeller domain-containing protein n=1 Tax=Stackebrandtia endophytica TaxID=1496996 RepID=A0A543AYM9_9ACTN|nr:beta-propeller domain-containing protein [Stackebrandtia endophytica]TQL77689.1 beta propeller domain-containing protein [Stackebrandtia endophytica]